MARVPQDLADRVHQYAALHRQSISVVIREGLHLLLVNTASNDFLSDTKTLPATAIVSDKKTAALAIMSDTKGEILSDRNKRVSRTTKRSLAVLSFDTTKYVLGKLCPRGHDHEHTGQSLLRRSNRHCLACDREKFHERKQAKRQALP
jgi:hypothetical protein